VAEIPDRQGHVQSPRTLIQAGILSQTQTAVQKHDVDGDRPIGFGPVYIHNGARTEFPHSSTLPGGDATSLRKEEK
jgi:hypothetical protein